MEAHYFNLSEKQKRMIRPLKYLLLVVLVIYESRKISSMPSVFSGSELEDDSHEDSPAPSTEWNYKTDKGPNQWGWMFPHQCSGHHQSPIAIETFHTRRKDWDPFELRGYHDVHGRMMSLTNNGHSVQLKLDGNYTMRGGGLQGTFAADQIHFHWGPNNHQGSEHVLDRRKYPAEMHIVHHDQSLTGDNYLYTPGGLAVLGVFIEIGEENDAFSELVQIINKVKYKDESYLMTKAVRISDLLPENLDKFYRYFGSTTTPPCYEVVQWTVFKEPITVSERQMQALRGVFESRRPRPTHMTQQPEPLLNNFRPEQLTNGRLVYRCGF